MLCNVTHIARLRTSLLDKSKEFAQDLPAALLHNLLVVGCAILIKETVNLNKLKNQVGFLLGNRQTKTDSHYKRLTRFFNDQMAQQKLWKILIVWVLDYTKRWDGRSRSLYLTAAADRLGWHILAVRILPNPPAGVVSGLPGRKLAAAVARFGQKGAFLSTGAQTAAATSHQALSAEG